MNSSNKSATGSFKFFKSRSENDGLRVDIDGNSDDIDLGLENLIKKLESNLSPIDEKPKLSGSSLEELSLILGNGHRGIYYQSLLNAEAFDQLARVVDSDLEQYGESDLLARAFWVRSKFSSSDFPKGLVGIALLKLLTELPNQIPSPATDPDRFITIKSLETIVPDSLRLLKPVAPELSESILALWLQKQKRFNGEVNKNSNEASTTNDSKNSTLNNASSTIPNLFASLTKSLFLLFSPLLFYILWKESSPGGVGGRAFNYLIGRESEAIEFSKGPWLQIELDRPWKDYKKVTFQYPTIERLEKLDDLSSISYNLDNLDLPNLPSKSDQAAEQIEIKPTLPTLNKENRQVKLDLTGPIQKERIEPEPDPIQQQEFENPFPREKYFVTGQNPSPSNNSSIIYYTVVKSLFVYTSPDYSAFKLAKLRSGDQIEGLYEEGNWLRVRSNKGQIGFVPLADVVRED